MAKKELVSVAHALPGRIRLRFPSEKKGIPNMDDFLGIKGVKEVIFNNITKSLVIVHDPEIVHTKKLLSYIEERNPQINLVKEKPMEKAQPDILSQLVFKTAKDVNKNISMKTGGFADITSIVPSFLFLLGMEELVRKPVMPRWYDLMWYATNIYYWKYRDAYNGMRDGGRNYGEGTGCISHTRKGEAQIPA